MAAMDHRLVEGLMEAIAPVIKTSFSDSIEKATGPLLQRLTQLEARPVEKGEPGPPGPAADLAEVALLVIPEVVKLIPAPENGKDADPEAVEALVTEKVAAQFATIPTPKDGKDADPEEIAARLRDDVVARLAAEIPPPKDGIDGKDADPDFVAAFVTKTVAAEVAKLPVPLNGKDGTDGTNGKDIDPDVVSEVISEFVAEAVADVVAKLPAPLNGTNGKDGTDGEPGKPGEMSLVPDDLADDVARVIRLMAEFPTASRRVAEPKTIVVQQPHAKKRMVIDRDAQGFVVGSHEVEEEVEA